MPALVAGIHDFLVVEVEDLDGWDIGAAKRRRLRLLCPAMTHFKSGA
jgi:hypothetical protein